MEIGRLHVRRNILIHAQPRQVWQHFTSFERLAAWFQLGHTLEAFEPNVGSTVTLSVEINGERRGFGGPILVFDADREFSFKNNWEDEAHAWPVATFITLRLTPLYEGTLVELFHHGFERLGKDAADNLQGYEAGWDAHHLEALRMIVEANDD